MRIALVPLVLVASLTVPCRDASAAYAQTTFQIGGMIADIRADTTMLQRIHAAGLDWVFWYGVRYATLPGAAEVSANLETLRAHRAGFALKALACYQEEPGDPPQPHRPGRLYWNRDRPPSRAAIDSTLSPTHGICSPSVLGYFVWDEPDTNDALAFTNIGLISRWIAANPNTADKLAFTNLLSACFIPDDATYAAYLRRYLDLFDGMAAPVLSFDEYPFQLPTRVETNWFRTLRLVRDAANAYGRGGQVVPWYAWIELSPFHFPAQTAFSPMFSVVNTRWQAYTALAYGAKGLCYFQLAPDSSKREVWGDGIFRANGDTVSTKYSAIRALNADLHHLGPTLMRLDPVAAFRPDTLCWTGTTSERVPGTGRTHGIVSRFAAGSDSALAGHLKDRTNGDNYLMVVNLALIANGTFTLTLSDAADSLYRVDRETGTQRLWGTRTDTLRLKGLPPGQGELFRIVR